VEEEESAESGRRERGQRANGAEVKAAGTSVGRRWVWSNEAEDRNSAHGRDAVADVNGGSSAVKAALCLDAVWLWLALRGAAKRFRQRRRLQLC